MKNIRRYRQLCCPRAVEGATQNNQETLAKLRVPSMALAAL